MLFYIIENPKMLKGIYMKKDQKGIFVRENLKNKHRYLNVIWSEKTLMHKAERPSDYFFQFFHI